MNKQYSQPTVDVTVWERKNVFLATSAEDQKTNAEDNVIGWDD